MSIAHATALMRDMLHPEQWGHAIPADLAKEVQRILPTLCYDPHRVYLSGPMSGIAHYNIPAFADAALALRTLGYSVFAPHENGLPPEHTWDAHMRVDIAALMTCGSVAMLPGWRTSKGAYLEHDIATRLGMPVRPLAHYLDTAKP